MVIPEPPSIPSQLLLAIHPRWALQLLALGTLVGLTGDAANLPEGKSCSSPSLRGSSLP